MGLKEDGFSLVPGVFSGQEMADAVALLPTLESAGSRKLLQSQVGQHFANDPRIRALVEEELGAKARAVRAILFDKTGERNWTLGLHQDTKIALKAKQEIDGYIHWSVKEGIPHCQPPVEYLMNSVAVRIHFDPCPESRGALMVVPGSHQKGFAVPTEIHESRIQALPCEIGDVILMKPLTYHGSKAATDPGHRRVLHIEYCSLELPAPLEWAFLND